MIMNAPRITLAAACAAGLFATIAVAGPSTTPGAPVLSTSGGISSPRNFISPEAEIVDKPSDEVVLSYTPAEGNVDVIAKPSENQSSQVIYGGLNDTLVDPSARGGILASSALELAPIANGTGGPVNTSAMLYSDQIGGLLQYYK